MPQKHPFAVTNFIDYCQAHGLDKKRDNFRRRVRLSLWRAVGSVTWGAFLSDDPNYGRDCLCDKCTRAPRITPERPVKDVEAAKLRAYKQKRLDADY